MGSIRDNANLKTESDQKNNIQNRIYYEGGTEEIKKIRFCPYCGTKLIEGARFCSNCGASVLIDMQAAASDDEIKHSTAFPEKVPAEYNSYTDNAAEKLSAPAQNTAERKMIYEGILHKCPNCGEIVDAFVTQCPSCGYEIRGAKSAATVKVLSYKLEQISSQKMPPLTEESGKAHRSQSKRENDARFDFEKSKEKEKASLITNFAIPNTKEDILAKCLF